MIKIIRFADVVSLLNASCGFIAALVLFIDVLSPISLRIRISATFIFLGLLADGLDGIIARKKGKGPLGEYIESMADMSSMIIAPSLVVFSLFQGKVSDSISLMLIFISVILLYVICGVIRLAAFNPLKYQKTFIGLPSSAAALILLLMSVFYASFFYILPIMFVISILMILPISFPKPSVMINTIAAFLILVTLFLWDLFFKIGPLSLLTCLLLYIFLGPLLKQKIYLEKQ